MGNIDTACILGKQILDLQQELIDLRNKVPLTMQSLIDIHIAKVDRHIDKYKVFYKPVLEERNK